VARTSSGSGKGESSRPSREEDDRQEKERGNLGTLSEKQIFKDLSTGIRDNQEKSCSFVMKEVSESRTPMEGAGLGSPSAFACAEGYSSSPIHDDLAKLVVDIEYSSSLTFKCNGLGQEGFLEAQPDMVGTIFPLKKKVGQGPPRRPVGERKGVEVTRVGCRGRWRMYATTSVTHTPQDIGREIQGP